ncbi:MAG: bifunctional riboflavin kinase/FAD synthetase [bacterium]
MVISVGFFDGFHIAHQEVIKDSDIVITFDTYPKAFFNRINSNNLLTTNFEKYCLIKEKYPNVNIEFFIFKKIYSLLPEEFIKLLKELYDFKYIKVGYDFRFGINALGNILTLKKFQKKYKYELIVVNPIKVDNRIVHSKYIRNYLKNGKLDWVFKMLDRNYSFSGVVVEGNKIGRKIGFPTANLLVSTSKIMPPYGIYKVKLEIEGNIYYGLLHLGPRPVINDFDTSIEVWIKNFNQEIYYKEITVEILQFIRKIKNFSNLNKLKEQIKKDIEVAKI